jgi:hypothetical protein
MKRSQSTPTLKAPKNFTYGMKVRVKSWFYKDFIWEIVDFKLMQKKNNNWQIWLTEFELLVIFENSNVKWIQEDSLELFYHHILDDV